ncbi:hypothetical protein JQN72_00400 [Phycicoccus sp. CSK15P-2]|uniref:hypothetical protein n=1 Tax=Phycicoccus sp. CSK15P-2 TaxID=2807627 RepID=UPI00194E7613|nr:hypothetical protein [Phycicoccus sp. CSK15P-2]MBM6402704.1 hypothetical protein [Phycicoccus sp. CSK15P-2]
MSASRMVVVGLVSAVALGAVLAGYLVLRGDRCALADDGSSPCGVLLGVTSERPDLGSLAEAERFAGRPYDLVYRFHGLDDTVPTDEERALVDSGRALHLNIETRVGPSPTDHTWADVAAGLHDDRLRDQARGIASLDAPVMVTYDHEMDLPKKQGRGTPQDFVAAWRRVHGIFHEEGADNAVWVWVAAALEDTLHHVGEFWPGNDVVDWVSWDAYTRSGCDPLEPSTTVGEAVDVFHDWLEVEGPRHGIDPEKPLMVSELGGILAEDAPMTRQQWYAQIPAMLRERPRIRALGLWDYSGTCDFRYSNDPTMRDTLRGLAASEVFARLPVDAAP